MPPEQACWPELLAGVGRAVSVVDNVFFHERCQSFLTIFVLLGAVSGSIAAKPTQSHSVHSKATMSDVVFNEYDSTMGYTLGQRSEYVCDLQYMSAALGYSELPRYFWASVDAIPRPNYIVEVRIYHAYLDILAHKFRIETPRDHIEYAISDAASMALLRLRREYDHLLSNGLYGLAPDTRRRMQPEVDLPITDDRTVYLAHIAQGARHAHHGAVEEINFLRFTLANERITHKKLHHKAKCIQNTLEAFRQERDIAIAQLDGGPPMFYAGEVDAPVLALHSPPSPPPFRRLLHTARKRTPSTPATLDEQLRDPTKYAPHRTVGYLHSLFGRRRQ